MKLNRSVGILFNGCTISLGHGIVILNLYNSEKSADGTFISNFLNAGSSSVDWYDWMPVKRKTVFNVIKQDGTFFNSYAHDQMSYQRPALSR